MGRNHCSRCSGICTNSFCNLTDNKAALDAVNSVDASSVKGASKAATQTTSKTPEFEEEDFNEDAESL